ncbi:FUN14 domain-containing protein 1B-like [Bradysia coprophila]|uniref:FUN14 domain-containing protein 1B-like n=1 Tax=Bradysia coprophila TaxID=38358 RepID=UPI00187D859B|nr:FUN14 domain-containing protein 1B-like [Bradysia coprophila]
MTAASSYLEKFFGGSHKKSVATKQILIGSLSGWFTGYSTMKIGKTAAFLLGGGIIFLEVANEQGWIRIDWNQVSDEIDKAAERVEEVTANEGPRFIDRIKQLCLNNATTATGFVGGFLIGFSMS